MFRKKTSDPTKQKPSNHLSLILGHKHFYSFQTDILYILENYSPCLAWPKVFSLEQGQSFLNEGCGSLVLYACIHKKEKHSHYDYMGKLSVFLN